jgi:type IV pilus assembly protein PilE
MKMRKTMQQHRNHPLKYHPNRPANGMGLIECLVAVALGATLAAMAMPLQTVMGMRLQRAQARTALAQAAWWMEREASLSGSYPTQVSDAAWPADAVKYRLSLSWTGGSYVLRATPTGQQAGDACGALWLSQSGQRGADGTGSACW